MLILVQKGKKCFIICPWAKNGCGLRRNVSPLTGLLTVRFECQMSKEVIYWPVKEF